MDKAQALNKFWNSFGISAYDATTVPDEALENLTKLSIPYITYEVKLDNMGNVVSLSGSLWYRSISWAAISAKEQEIANYISRGGRLVKYTDGAIWVKMGNPWAQRMSDPEDDMIRRIYLTLSVEYLD